MTFVSFQVCFAVLTIIYSGSSAIELRNNGYENILFKIGDNIPENPNLLGGLQEMLNNASIHLYKATEGLLYFRKVTVVVPSHWNGKADYVNIETPMSMNFADIRIDEPNMLYNNTPYTIQTGGCMEIGLYTHLTPQFIVNYADEMHAGYGDLGKLFLHEWGHLRYGLFDEYGHPESEMYPAFYLDLEHNVYKATACMKDVIGHVRDYNGKACYIDKATNKPVNCMFVPDKKLINMTASLMYEPSIPSVTQFCDDSRQNKHNSYAPSKHNLMCDYLPTWSVLNNHPDFQQSSKRKFNESLSQMDVEMTVVQPAKNSAPRYVIVSDVSFSMNLPSLKHGFTRLKCLQTTIKRFLNFIVQDGSYVGVVTFNHRSQTLANLTRIDSLSKSQLTKDIPQHATGSTSIGSGLLEAIKVLSINGSSTEGANVILISDGKEDHPPMISDVMGEIERSKVIVTAIAMGPDASDSLPKLVKTTKGRAYYFGDKDTDLSRLDQAFRAATNLQKDIDDIPVQILLKNVVIGRSETYNDSVILDDGLGNSTTFEFDDMDALNTKVSIESPTGIIYHETSQFYLFMAAEYAKIFKFPYCQPGQWKFTVRAMDNVVHKQTVTVTSNAVSKTVKVVRVRCWLSNTDVDLSNNNNFVRIFAHVSRGYDAVIRAQVEAIINKPDGSLTKVSLHDDGSGGDVTADDGIYTTIFTEYTSDNRYSVIARVINDGKARVRVGTRGSSSAPIFITERINEKSQSSFKFSSFSWKNSPNTKTADVNSKAVSQFERTVTADAFLVTNHSQFRPDTLPPSRVTDLRIIETSQKEDIRIVQLAWHAVGSDLDVGQSNTTELRFSYSFEKIYQNFSEQIQLTDRHVVNGSLKPLLSHLPQMVTVLINTSSLAKEYRRRNLYFGLKVRDQDGNSGQLSNIVTASFIDPKEIYDSTIQTTAILTTSKFQQSTVSNKSSLRVTTEKMTASRYSEHHGEVTQRLFWSILGPSLTLIIICLMLILFVIYKFSKERKSQNVRISRSYA